MQNIYSYDNCNGDKGIIIADSYESAVAIYKNEYPNRTIDNGDGSYWNDDGCIISEVGTVLDNSLYNVFPV